VTNFKTSKASISILMYFFNKLFDLILNWGNKKPSFRLVICLFFLVTSTFSYGQNSGLKSNSNRSHFIIAYDIRASRNNNIQIKNLLVSLFSNQGVPSNIVVSNNEALNRETADGISFFNPATDDISFYFFGISRSNEFAPLKDVFDSRTQDSIRIYTTFIHYFIKKNELTWSSYNGFSGSTDEKVNKIFTSFLNSTPICNSDFSDPEFVFPFILTKTPITSFSGEYILVMMSCGPVNPAASDLFTIPNNGMSALRYIQNYKSYLSSGLKGNLLFNGIIPLDNNVPQNIQPITEIKIYKIIPQDQEGNGTIKLNFEIKTDIRLSQNLFATSKFKVPPVEIETNLNEKHTLQAIRLSIFSNNGDKRKQIIDTIIVQKNNDNWESDLIKEPNVIFKKDGQLNIPEVVLSLKTLSNDRNFSSLTFQYSFFSKYLIKESNALNYIFNAQKTIKKQNVQYSSKIIRIIMLYIIPTVILLIIVIFMILYGKPVGIVMKVEGYLDSFEVINYNDQGRLNTPYKNWNTREDHLMVYGKVFYKRPNYIFNWSPKVLFKIQIVKLIPGFEVFIKESVSILNEYSPGHIMPVSVGKNNQFSFVIGVRQNDITLQLKEPQLMKVAIEGVAVKSVLVFECERRTELEYKFHLGPDLGVVWVGFDPGTTGSCVAVGSSTENIILSKDRTKQEIIPSIIVFDISEKYKPNGSDLPKNIYKYGFAAKTVFNDQTKRYQGFRSIKKLLGYKDIKEITFSNNCQLKFEGKDLASLLVKGLFDDAVNYLEKGGFNAKEYLQDDNRFNPKRAVVAIPNNFTINKIQDMVDCIRKLDQFTDIRFVYEAEAVLFYYLSNYKRLSTNENTFQQENILVFDMGGATLNATAVNANTIQENNGIKYEVDLLGKIGYGIGGDTLDYCLAKIILGFVNEFPEFNQYNTNSGIISLAKKAEAIKLEISRRYYKTTEPYLISTGELEDTVKEALGLSIKIEEESSELYSYFKRGAKNQCKLFKHPELVKTIYDNVVDSVNEVVRLSNKIKIDTVIFSGRSTYFPMIKETVEEQLKSLGMTQRHVILQLEESKTAVAKGTCWYGINKNAIKRNNLKTNASFGFKKTEGSIPEYHELVKMGSVFDVEKEGADFYSGEKKIRDAFDFDGNKVNFYQIMGKDANKIIEENEKHKFSKIASIILPQITSEVAMKVNENDDVECAVRLVSNEVIIAKGSVSDQEIDEENEDHYTWVVK